MMMTCKQLSEIASDFLDRDLPFRQRLAIHLHRLMCRDCSRYLRHLNISSRAVQRISDKVEPSDQEIDQLMDKILK